MTEPAHESHIESGSSVEPMVLRESRDRVMTPCLRRPDPQI